MCRFDDEIDLEGFLDDRGREMGLSGTQHSAVLRLRDLLFAYHPTTQPPDPSQIINDPEWHRVQLAAQDAAVQLEQPEAF